MSHHDKDEDTGRSTGQQVLKVAMAGLLAMVAAAVVASLDDIRRYLHIKRM